MGPSIFACLDAQLAPLSTSESRRVGLAIRRIIKAPCLSSLPIWRLGTLRHQEPVQYMVPCVCGLAKLNQLQ
jgi:hypothetical protein